MSVHPLHEAVLAGDLERIQARLKTSPDLVFSKDPFGWAPLHWAAYKGQEMAEFLLAVGANVNVTDEGWSTPLHYTARWGNKAVTELLLANNAKVNATDIDGYTPLHYAAARDEYLAELLRQHGGQE